MQTLFIAHLCNLSFNKGVFSREKKDDITVNFKLQEKQTICFNFPNMTFGQHECVSPFRRTHVRNHLRNEVMKAFF